MCCRFRLNCLHIFNFFSRATGSVSITKHRGNEGDSSFYKKKKLTLYSQNVQNDHFFNFWSPTPKLDCLDLFLS